MSNIIVSVRLSLDIPEKALEKMVGRPDDGSEQWYHDASDAAVERIQDDPQHCIREYCSSDPVVDI